MAEKTYPKIARHGDEFTLELHEFDSGHGHGVTIEWMENFITALRMVCDHDTASRIGFRDQPFKSYPEWSNRDE